MLMIYLGTQLLLLRCSCFFVIAVKLKAKDYTRITSILFCLLRIKLIPQQICTSPTSAT